MLLTIFLAIVFCAAITLMLISAVAFIQNKKFFSSAPKEAQKVIQPRTEELFYGARTIGWALLGFSMSISWCDDMDAWLKYHVAFILPVVYLCYKTGCDLKRSTKEERKLLLDAAGDAYHLLMGLGYPVRPAGDEKSLEPGLANELARLVIYWVSRTKLGALCTTEHCRHAPREMEELDRAFQKLRAEKQDFPMPHFDRLYGKMPSWDKIRLTYGR